jgi:non-specific serine/threonine protein kinase
MTQESLAERAGLSVHGVQKLEAGASHPYRDTVRRLLSAMPLSLEDARALEAVAQPAPRNRSRIATQAADEVGTVLPAQLTSFIGREQEIHEIVQLLHVARLVTLTGVGGCGKTRLALEVARQVHGQYGDGVWFIELASLADPALVPQAVAASLGIREGSAQPLLKLLTSALKPRHALLVLDNCEHLLNACAQLVSALLTGCPRLQVVATSREALGLTGEISRRVPSLLVPPSEEPLTLEALAGYTAVQLFVDRAQAVQPSFGLSERNAASIAQICIRLDGIPLALELAAALVRGISVEQQASRLDQRFRLLTGGSRAALPRQQTLRATIDWSYELLTETERMLFARLSVFAGSWTLEAAESVCTGDGIDRGAVVELLLHLVDKSLVDAMEESDGVDRYRLLDTLRQYARERLLSGGHAEAVHSLHAEYYLSLAERVEPELDLPSQRECIELLSQELGNLRAALEWQIAGGDAQNALRLAGVVARFWEVRGHLREGRKRLTEVLALPAASASTRARAKVLDGAGVLALYQYDVLAARPLFKESLALYRQHRDWHGVAWVLIHLGWFCHDTGRLKAAFRFLREAVQLCEQLGDRRGSARALTLLGSVTFWAGDFTAARALHEQSLAQTREVGDRWGTAWALHNLGMDLLRLAELGQNGTRLAQPALEESFSIWSELGERRHLAFVMSDLGTFAASQHDFVAARARLNESLSTFTELGDVHGKWVTLLNCALLFNAEGKYEQAVQALGGAATQLKVGLRRSPPFAGPLWDRHLSTARSAMDPRQFAAAWQRGEAMALDEAIAYVYQQLASTGPHGVRSAPPGPSTAVS